MTQGSKNGQNAKPANDAGPAGVPEEDAAVDLRSDAGAIDVGAAEGHAEELDEAVGAETPEAARIAELEGELARMREQAMRALAEAENTRKRAEKQAQDASRYGPAGLARDILSVADNLQRALDALPPASDDDGDLLKNLRAGVEMTAKELQDALARHHIKAVHPHGEKFDHNLHQAMFEMESEEHPPGHVGQVVQVGYTLHDRLLRPAMVGVVKKPSNDG